MQANHQQDPSTLDSAGSLSGHAEIMPVMATQHLSTALSVYMAITNHSCRRNHYCAPRDDQVHDVRVCVPACTANDAAAQTALHKKGTMRSSAHSVPSVLPCPFQPCREHHAAVTSWARSMMTNCRCLAKRQSPTVPGSTTLTMLLDGWRCAQPPTTGTTAPKTWPL